MKPYNGHRSYSAWNQSLWIGNDEPLYRWALDCLKQSGNRPSRAARMMMRDLAGTRTPDGVPWNFLGVKLVLTGLE